VPIAVNDQTRIRGVDEGGSEVGGESLGDGQSANVPGDVAGTLAGIKSQVAQRLRDTRPRMITGQEERGRTVRAHDLDSRRLVRCQQQGWQARVRPGL